MSSLPGVSVTPIEAVCGAGDDQTADEVPYTPDPAWSGATPVNVAEALDAIGPLVVHIAGDTMTGDLAAPRVAVNASAWSTVEKLRVNTPTTPTVTANTMLAGSAYPAVPVIIQTAPASSANALVIQDSAGGQLLAVNYSGGLGFGATPDVWLYRTGVGMLAVERVGYGSVQLAQSNLSGSVTLLDDSAATRALWDYDGTAVRLSSAGGKPLRFGTSGAATAVHIANGGTVEIGSTGTPGTVEKLRVNTPTTVDNAANVMIAASAASSRALVIQGAPSQSADLFAIQDSAGAAKLSVSSGGEIGASSIMLGTSYASTGIIRIPNNQMMYARNAANTADVLITYVDTSNNVHIGGSGGGAATTIYGNGAVSGKFSSAHIQSYVPVLANNNGSSATATVLRLKTCDWTTVDNSANLIASASATTSKPVVIQAAASQTANLLETQTSAGTTHFAVTPGGLPKWTDAADVQTTVGAAGAASALPATPTGYLKADVAGTTYVVPYYTAT